MQRPPAPRDVEEVVTELAHRKVACFERGKYEIPVPKIEILK